MINDNETYKANCDRLLRFLGIDRRKPSIYALQELVFAFVTKIPFENISKLYYLKREGLRNIPDFDRYLTGIEKYHFGGTCYSNNYYLHLVLRYLGYEADLCGADMRNPDVHIVNLVRIEGREFLVDAGNAAPFTEPLPRDLNDKFVVELGKDQYILEPQDHRGRSRMIILHDGIPRSGYIVKPIPRTIGYFTDVIVDSYRKEATFMNALLLTRFFKNRSVRIHNLTAIYSDGPDYRTEQINNRENLPTVIERLFGIPSAISDEILPLIGEFADVWNNTADSA